MIHLTNICDLGNWLERAGGAIAGQGVILAEASFGRQSQGEESPLRSAQLSSVKHVAFAFAGTSTSQTQKAARLPMILATSTQKRFAVK